MKQHNIFLVIFLSVCTFGYSQDVKSDSLAKHSSENDLKFRYYYYPNLQFYYDVLDDNYISQEKGQWVRKSQMPRISKGYSMSNNVYIPIKDYLGDEPYLFFDQHKADFPPNFKSKKQTKVVVRKKSN